MDSGRIYGCTQNQGQTTRGYSELAIWPHKAKQTRVSYLWFLNELGEGIYRGGALQSPVLPPMTVVKILTHQIFVLDPLTVAKNLALTLDYPALTMPIDCLESSKLPLIPRLTVQNFAWPHFDPVAGGSTITDVVSPSPLYTLHAQVPVHGS